MNITTKFSLGQTVWKIGRARGETVKLPCRFCRGSNQVRVSALTGDDYALVKCPRCHGRGSVSLAEIPLFSVVGQAQIGKIVVERVDPTVQGFNGLSSSVTEEDRYMLSSTGFPSGSVYTNIDLFPSKDEAIAACDERNESIREGRLPNQWKPDRHIVEAMRAFLDHRDVYEHDEEHVEMAGAIIAAYEYEPEDEA